MNRRLRTGATTTALALSALLGACGSGDDEPAGATGGAADPRAVVDAHVAAMLEYDLEAQCRLLTPEHRETMAAIDGGDADGYCTRATAEVLEMADEETRRTTREIYEGVEITTVERAGEEWFHLESSDGGYHEEVLPVEVDGRWWIATVDSHSHDDHDEGGHEPGQDEPDGEEPEPGQPDGEGPP